MITADENISRLDNIEKVCSNKNWNGYNADPVTKDTVDFCKKLICNLGTQPIINPTAADSIQLEYESDSEYLEIEVFTDDVKIYMEHGIDGENGKEAHRIKRDINLIVDEVQKYLYSL